MTRASSWFHERNIFVTGGSGYIGTRLVTRLVSLGARVTMLSRGADLPASLAPLADRLAIATAEISDREAITRVVQSVSPSVVFHLSAYGTAPQQMDAAEMIRTNIEGTQALLEACAKAQLEAIVATGSWTEYGLPVREVVRENDPTQPASLYGITKLAATLLIRTWSLTTGIPTTTLRLGSVYGSGEAAHRLTATLAASANTGTPATLGNPETIRDFIHVEDVVDALLLAAERRGALGRVLNIASGVGTSVNAFATAFQTVVPACPKPIWGQVPPRSWDVPRWVADIAQARVELGWQPSRELLTALKEEYGRINT